MCFNPCEEHKLIDTRSFSLAVSVYWTTQHLKYDNFYSHAYYLNFAYTIYRLSLKKSV